MAPDSRVFSEAREYFRRPGGIMMTMTSNDSDSKKKCRKRGANTERGFKPYHSVSVPKNADLMHNQPGDRPKTTVMLRNIPNRYSQAGLLKEIDAAGFKGSYDFFYLPMDTKNRTNVGYAFINFLSTEERGCQTRVTQACFPILRPLMLELSGCWPMPSAWSSQGRGRKGECHTHLSANGKPLPAKDIPMNVKSPLVIFAQGLVCSIRS